MKRIAVVGWEKSLNNIGDILLIDATSWLCRQIDEFEIVRVDWAPDSELPPRKYRLLWNIRMIMGAPVHLFDFNTRITGRAKYWCRKKWYDLYLKRYYRMKLKDVDAIITAGGGILKFETQDHSFYTECLLQIAKELGKPVMLNAVGIEGYKPYDVRCKKLISTLNRSSVKRITTRDDIENLQNYFVEDKSIKCELVADPVWWLSDVFGIMRYNRNGIVGVNLIQSSQFENYKEYNLSQKQVLQLYIDILTELTNRGHRWKLFCNGIHSDYQFGEVILNNMGLDPKVYMLPMHSSTEEYLENLCSFKGVIAGRMHALISAYALDIPCAAMVWSVKMKFFAERAGLSSYFLEKEAITAKNIVDALERAMNNREIDITNKEKVSVLKEATLENIRCFFKEI